MHETKMNIEKKPVLSSPGRMNGELVSYPGVGVGMGVRVPVHKNLNFAYNS